MTIKPEDISPLDPSRKIEESSSNEELSGKPFEEFMKDAAKKKSIPSSIAASPFQVLYQKPPLATTPTLATLIDQTKITGSTLADMANQLQTPNLKLKQSEKYLLRNKLTEGVSQLKTVNAKMGLPPPPNDPSVSTSSGGIFGKFLDLIQDGQANAMAARRHLVDLQTKGSDLRPADFLMIQIKLAHAQQQLEFASTMLGNAISGMKMLFNTQL